jgi:hypothetical protein
MPVGVDLVRADENLQVPDQMSENKQDHDATGAGHDIFPADRGAKQVSQ